MRRLVVFGGLRIVRSKVFVLLGLKGSQGIEFYSLPDISNGLSFCFDSRTWKRWLRSNVPGPGTAWGFGWSFCSKRAALVSNLTWIVCRMGLLAFVFQCPYMLFGGARMDFLTEWPTFHWNCCRGIATQWTASVHTLHLHMSCDHVRVQFKVLCNGLLRYILITFVIKVLCNGLLRCILYHVQTCDNVRVQGAMQWTAWVYVLYTCPNLR